MPYRTHVSDGRIDREERLACALGRTRSEASEVESLGSSRVSDRGIRSPRKQDRGHQQTRESRFAGDSGGRKIYSITLEMSI